MTQFNGNGNPRNGSSGEAAIADNPMTEDALDQVIEDSFPASDPPSHTPTTGLGAPKGVAEEPAQSRWERPSRTIIAAGAGVALLLAAVVAFVWRRRS